MRRDIYIIQYFFFLVYYLKDLVDKDCEPQHMSINLQEAPTHLAVSSDQELLAVTGGQLLSVYNIFNFQNTVSMNYVYMIYP